MSASRKLITWQPVLTDHQAYTYEQLARRAGAPLVAFVAELEDPTRRAQGWRDTQVATLERCLIPQRGALRYCLRQLRAHRHEVHLFGSPFHDARLMACLFLAVWMGIETYLVSEPYSPTAHGYLADERPFIGRFKAWARPLAYRLYVLALKQRLAGIFAISHLAVTQYSAAGMDEGRIFPFGYFVPRSVPASNLVETPYAGTTALRLVFVGSLIARKGLDLLIEAVAAARGSGADVTLDAFGPGDPGLYSFDGESIRYRGRIAFGETQAVVSHYDVLVLPSRFDGWGVVVNEALCAGVPVICSDRVGAGVLVETFGAGALFDSAADGSLRDLLIGLARDPARVLAMRESTRAAADAIQPEIAAAYLLEVIQAPRGAKTSIPSPWYPSTS